VRSAPALVSLILAVGFGLGASASVRAETELLPPPPKPWLGIGFDDQGTGIAYVRDVHPGTGASAVGLQPDDVIVEIDGRPLSPVVTLPLVINQHRIGQRITLTVFRVGPDGIGKQLRLSPRLSAMPTTEELVYRRLFDRALPALTLFDRHGAAVPAADWTRRPQVWMVFDAHCENCSGAASALRTRLVESEDGAADVPMRTIVLGKPEELGAYMARVPIMGTVWRSERGDDERPFIYRYFLSGVDARNDGVILVLDHRGIVRFATAISAGDTAHEGACAAAARAARAWRP
jgi:hypothetical protein